MPVAPWWEEFGSTTSTDTPSNPAGTSSPTAPGPAPVPDDVQVHRSPRPRGLRALQVGAAVLAGVLVVLVALLAVRSAEPSATGATSAPSASAPATPAESADAASASATDDAAALQELEALRAQGLAAHPPTGQWAAQLAAKSIGTTDPGQVAANGSHTFYAGDILAQSRRIAAGPAGADVFVLRSDDYGKDSIDARGNPYWTTLAAGPFASKADVQTWCDSLFGDVPAETRSNVCMPRQLLPVE